MQDWHLRTVSTRRVGVAVFAYACLLAQVSTFVHRALVQHVTCAEHGEAVHVAAQSRSGDLADNSGLRPSSTLARLPRAFGVTTTVADDHDHCAAALSPSVKAPSPPHQGTGPAATFLGVNSPSPRVDGTDVDTYLIAPKTSPPV
jgi:hypothetical protein